MINKGRSDILFVLEYFAPHLGGVETLFFQLAKELVHRGTPVTVLTSWFDPSLPKEEVADGIRIIRVPARNRYLFTLMALPTAIRLARKSKLIHTTTYNAAVPALIAGLIAKRKVLITVHEVWDDLWFRLPWMGKISASLHFLFEWMLLKLPFDHFVAVSGFTKASLIKSGIPAHRIDVIYNGLDYAKLGRYAAASPLKKGEEMHFVYYGRLGHSKGIDLIIRAGAIFLEAHHEATIELIVPRSPARFRRKVEQAAGGLPVAKRMIFTDSLPREELFERLLKATAVLIPSYREGFCFAAAECAALGIPVISSEQGALIETTGGRVIRMKAMTPDALAEAMHLAVMGAWEEKPEQRFPLEDQVNDYLALYPRL
jgi:glycosyltransferase involved in cell wall biosynthesis